MSFLHGGIVGGFTKTPFGTPFFIRSGKGYKKMPMARLRAEYMLWESQRLFRIDPLSGTWGGRAPGSCAEKSKDKFTDHDAEEEAEVEAELGFGDEEDDKENARPAVEHVGHAGLMDVDVEVDGVEKVSPADVNTGAERDGAGDVSLMDIAAGGHCEPVGATASGAPPASAWPDDDEFWFPQESDSDDSDWDDDDDDDDEDDDFGGLGIRIDLPIAGVACETGAGAAAHGVLAALAGTEGEGVLMLDVGEAGVRLTGTLGQLAAAKAAQAFRPMGGAAEGVLVGRSVGPRAVRTTNVVVGGVHAGCGRLAGAAARRGVAPRGAASGSAKSAWRDRGNGADTLAVAGERTPGRTPVVEAGDALMGKAVARGGGRSEGRDAGWRPVGGDEMDVQDADWSLIGGYKGQQACFGKTDLGQVAFCQDSHCLNASSCCGDEKTL